MKNYEVLDLGEMLAHYVSELKILKGAKFGYALLKNIDIISKEAKVIQDVQKIEDDFKKFEEKRIALCEKFSEKDEHGKAKKIYKSKTSFDYELDKNNPVFLEEYKLLQDEFKVAIEKQNSNGEEYKLFLQENNSIELFKISFDVVPEDISVELLSVIKVFIND